MTAAGRPLRRRTLLRKRRKDPLRSYLASLHRAIVLHRDGYRCRWCRRSPKDVPSLVLHCAHIKSQGAHPRMKYDTENAVALCTRCHLYRWHKDPQAAWEWIRTELPNTVLARLELAARSRAHGRTDLLLVRVGLEAEAQRLAVPLPAAPRVA